MNFCCCWGVMPAPYRSVATSSASPMMAWAFPMMSNVSTLPKFSMSACTILMNAGGVMSGDPSTQSPCESCTFCGLNASYSSPLRSSDTVILISWRSSLCSSGCRRSLSRATRCSSFFRTSAAGRAPAAVACCMFASMSSTSASSTSPLRVIMPISADIAPGLPLPSMRLRRSCADPSFSAMTLLITSSRSKNCCASPPNPC
mmetsp:Transcript_5714/g.12581  ORF Transcript_5714/g.12581 Transcript_5714/m.12581 type:complete len:202 (+) Transcript_5714:306-911(+)